MTLKFIRADQFCPYIFFLFFLLSSVCLFRLLCSFWLAFIWRLNNLWALDMTGLAHTRQWLLMVIKWFYCQKKIRYLCIYSKTKMKFQSRDKQKNQNYLQTSYQYFGNQKDQTLQFEVNKFQILDAIKAADHRIQTEICIQIK